MYSEELPMKTDTDGGDDDDHKSHKDSNKVFTITRTKAIVLVVIVIVLIIFVGVLSGILSARQARKDALEERKEREKVRATDEPTSITMAPTEPTGPEPWYQVRLPQNILPIHYDFYLDPDLEKNTFKGNVSVLIDVTAKSAYMSFILIHINDMNVTRAKVFKRALDAKPNTASPGDELALKRVFVYPKNDFFVFELEEDLEIGQYVLEMAYNSTFSSQLNGLYISTYKNENNETR